MTASEILDHYPGCQLAAVQIDAGHVELLHRRAGPGLASQSAGGSATTVDAVILAATGYACALLFGSAQRWLPMVEIGGAQRRMVISFG